MSKNLNYFFFSKPTQTRWRNFVKIKRAYFSLIILLLTLILSLFSEFISNERPLIVLFQGQVYFPVIKFYPENTFMGTQLTEVDYHLLRKNPRFIAEGGKMIFSLNADGPFRGDFDLNGNPPYPPSSVHWLGTDSSARDIFARLLYGYRICMLFSLALTTISLIAGALIGGIQGFNGGRWDLWAQRIVEVWNSLPFLYVVLLIGSIYGRNFMVLLLVLAAFKWVGLSYYARAEFLKIKTYNFVKVAQVLGLSKTKIFFQQILPNALTPILTYIPFSLVGGISTLTALDFLGFGLLPPTPSWGELLQDGLKNLQAPWIAISSTLALFITLLLWSFVGEGLIAAFDPKKNFHFE